MSRQPAWCRVSKLQPQTEETTPGTEETPRGKGWDLVDLPNAVGRE